MDFCSAAFIFPGMRSYVIMCGITAYVGNKEPIGILVSSLKKLEYRGYDSWGIAVKGKDSFFTTKKVGRVGMVESLRFKGSESADSGGIHAGIAHTRWATTGAVTEKNAHPHLSGSGSVAVVHNGIVENYTELREELEGEGYFFKSECDSEVIPNLIQRGIDNGASFERACISAFRAIEGSYAIVAIHAGFEGLVAARNGSPLAIGIGKENDFFVASDVPAFLEYTNKVIYLSDGEAAVLGKSMKIIDISTLAETYKKPQTIEWNHEQAQKGIYPHFMLKEINEQEESIKKATAQEKQLIAGIAKEISRARGIFFIGSGTSYHACLFASYLFSHVAKMHINNVLASEFPSYKEFINEGTLVFAVSQSGETADVIDAVKASKEKGARVISIVNVMGSTLTRMADENIMMNSGPEICVLSTKTYTSQLAIITLLVYSVAGKTEEGKSILAAVSLRVREIIDESAPAAKKLAKKIKNADSLFLIGRDLAYPTALEGALKIKEVSYLHAEGFAGGELKHGTIALIEKGTPVIAFVPKDSKRFVSSNANEVKSRGAYVITVGAEKTISSDFHFQVTDFGFANPIAMIIPIQLLAYYLAVAKKLDPDKPRNLAKSVTVR